MSRNRDNGAERAVYGPLASPLGPGTVRVSAGGGMLLRPVASPEVLFGAPRKLGAFLPCEVDTCAVGTWASWAGIPLCTRHAVEAAA